jgi:hypothetical protein
MGSFVKKTAVVVLLGLAAPRAGSATLRETIPFWPAARKSGFVSDLGHAKEGTNGSYTQGTYTKAIQQSAPSSILSRPADIPSAPDASSLHFHSLQLFFYSSFYYSSFCNKAPPRA